ncbi:MAG: BMC domain-containing protein [Rhodothermaceae bacterium]|nr:BMC domain-containing protein [Rhodothermaceae bacterium]
MAGSGSSDHTDGALGLLETFGLVAAIEGVDAMLKASNVRLLVQERTVPGLITSTIVGETAAVRAAVDAGRAAAERVGTVVSAHVIPRPASDVWEVLERPDPVEAAPTPPRAPAKKTRASDAYEGMTVPELRRVARTQDHPTFQGRVISKASKAELLRFLRTGQP